LEIILGITAALCWGVSDFAARFATRRLGAYRALLFMQMVGFLTLAPYLAATGVFPRMALWGFRPWAYALFAGLINAISAIALYHSFEVGVLSVVAPISAAWPALTVTLALISGERLNIYRGAGLCLTFLGMILAAVSFSTDKNPADKNSSDADDLHRAHLARSVGWAAFSAAGFGVMFWWLGFHVIPLVGGAASVWLVRLTSLCTLALASKPARKSIRLPRGSIWWVLLVMGVLDTTAYVANNTGMDLGHVSHVAVVSVLSSLYGAVTTLLAWIFLRERLERSQWFGVFLLFIGIVLVSLHSPVG
jgi:drug/metabolite transporter (DMT)-like permease